MLIQGDSVSIPLADDSVDLVVTSPPYFALRSYSDGGEHYDGQIGSEPTPQEFLSALWAVMDECHRVLKPSGSLWVNLGDKYGGSGGNNNSNLGERATKRGPKAYNKAADVRDKSLMGLPWRFALGLFCPDPYRRTYENPVECWHGEVDGRCMACRSTSDQHIARAEVVWSKPNGLPESVTDRVRRSHEQWFHFTKEPRYFAAVDEIREPHKSEPGREGKGALSGQKAMRPVGPNSGDYNPLGKLPNSVWTIPSEPLKVPDHLGVDHFAAYPQEWPRRIILGWSPSGGVVLDPFAGTGTTVMVAEGLGRAGIGIDMSSDYLRLADWRINESGHFAKREERQVKKWEKEQRITKLKAEIQRQELVIETLRRGRKGKAKKPKGKPKKR